MRACVSMYVCVYVNVIVHLHTHLNTFVTYIDVLYVFFFILFTYHPCPPMICVPLSAYRFPHSQYIFFKLSVHFSTLHTICISSYFDIFPIFIWFLPSPWYLPFYLSSLTYLFFHLFMYRLNSIHISISVSFH